MILLLIQLTIQFNSIIFATNAPKLYAGGCGIYNDVIYYAGGIVDPDGTNSKHDFNYNVYSLKLKDGFSLDDNNNAPWQITSNGGGPISDFSSVVVNARNASLFVVGGKNRKKEDSFKKFNLGDNIWKSNQVTVDTFPAPDKLVAGDEMNYAYYLSTLTQDSNNKNLYFHFGGVTAYPNMTLVDGRKGLSLLNAVDGTWNKLNDGPEYVSDHTAAVYESKLYIVGGNNPYTVKVRPMDKILVYDYPSSSWSNMTAKGDIPEPRFGHSSVVIGSKMIIAGGSLTPKFDSFPISSIYSLELKNSALVYTEHKVSNFFNAYLGSLSYYNDHLIYTFGFHTGNILSNTQVVNIKGNEWNLVKSLPANTDNSGNNPTDLSESKARGSDLAAIIGGSIGGLLGLIIIVVIIWYVFKKKSKANNEENLSHSNNNNNDEELGPPALLQGNVWTPTKPGELKEANFTLNTDTMLPGFDDDLTHPSQNSWNGNTNTR
ncbi:hypothetical protein K502DRAFT_77411 [Neoconidiobolus thromboides FSU 785]|nr:hypothetical protein K502DRAFT_77411 [Neoconidiobolus thromboides FSU 785]